MPADHEHVTFCPFRRTDLHNSQPCMRGKCELWADRYTTEGIRWEGCALRLGALTDSDGKIPV